MNDVNRIIVVAFKYNDILYAMATTEFKKSKYKKLVIFYIKGRFPKDFPFQEVFDEVVYVEYFDSISKLWVNLLKIWKMNWNCDVITYSNPLLLATKYLTKISNCSKIIWVEDGLMNYYPLSDINFSISRSLKRDIQKLLHLRDSDIYTKKQFITYLLCPDKAVSYKGELKPLIFKNLLNTNEALNRLSFIQGKKLFIGQALYNTDGISKNDYMNCVNRVIKEYGIDYYVPHYGSLAESIECPFLNLSDYHITFEFIACAYDFTLYSISSTLLYSTKSINPQVRTYMIRLEGIDTEKPILQETVNGIIDYQKK